MSQEPTLYYKTADLLFNTDTGEVSSPKQKLRLSPVNARVLNVLLQAPEKAVSRQQLFEGVWPNQVVSDDALTRSISDLRAQLKTIAKTESLIETIPKVGYRWQLSVEPVDKPGAVTKPRNVTFWALNLKPMLMALATLFVMLWALLGWLQHNSSNSGLSLIVLPTEYLQTNQSNLQQATVTDVSTWLKQAVMVQDGMQYLSSHAQAAYTGNPFPYYSHEFGVRWFIASEISYSGDKSTLTLNLIDAKTALVTYSRQHPFEQTEELKEHCQSFVGFIAQL